VPDSPVDPSGRRCPSRSARLELAGVRLAGGKGDAKCTGTEGRFRLPDTGRPISPPPVQVGPSVKDIFRTVSTGLSGTPMPSYSDSIAEADRWALAYYVLSLSAFKDPLTGEPMQISEQDRAALNDPALPASESRYAYRSRKWTEADRLCRRCLAKKHGFDFAAANAQDTK